MQIIFRLTSLCSHPSSEKPNIFSISRLQLFTKTRTRWTQICFFLLFFGFFFQIFYHREVSEKDCLQMRCCHQSGCNLVDLVFVGAAISSVPEGGIRQIGWFPTVRSLSGKMALVRSPENIHNDHGCIAVHAARNSTDHDSLENF